MSKANLLVGVSVGLLVLTSAALGIAEVTNRAVKPKPNPDPRIEERQAKAGMRFIPADEPTKVTAEEARDRATSSVQADLERSATDFTVELVRFSHDRPGADGQPIAQNRLVWKVTFYGTRVKPEGPKSRGGTAPAAPSASALDRSLTWVLVDANTGEIVAIYSAGPKD
jgi:hypothetical protein